MVEAMLKGAGGFKLGWSASTLLRVSRTRLWCSWSGGKGAARVRPGCDAARGWCRWLGAHAELVTGSDGEVSGSDGEGLWNVCGRHLDCRTWSSVWGVGVTQGVAVMTASVWVERLGSGLECRSVGEAVVAGVLLCSAEASTLTTTQSLNTHPAPDPTPYPYPDQR